MRHLTITEAMSLCPLMSDADNTPGAEVPNQKKTGKVIPGATSNDPFFVRAALKSPDAVRKYDSYLKEHKRRLRQLEKLAAGELTPSEDGYA
jgi:hypothetical protein